MPALFALAAAVGWGSSDFAAGYASRKSTATSVVILTHLASVIALLVITVRIGPGGISIDGSPTTADIMWGLAAGVAGGAGAMLLFQGLGKGSMAVVAPITATGAASIPVVFGIVTGDPLTVFGGLGIILALAAIVLVSLTGGDDGTLSDTTDFDLLDTANETDAAADDDATIDGDTAADTVVEALDDTAVDTDDEAVVETATDDTAVDTDDEAVVDTDADTLDLVVAGTDGADSEPMLVPAAWADEFQLPTPTGSRLIPSSTRGATARFDAQFDAQARTSTSTHDVAAAFGPVLPAHAGVSVPGDAAIGGPSVTPGFFGARMSAARVDVSVETEADLDTAVETDLDTAVEAESDELAADIDSAVETESDELAAEIETAVEVLDASSDANSDQGFDEAVDEAGDLDGLDAATSAGRDTAPATTTVTASPERTPREIRMSLRTVRRSIFILVATAVVSAAAIAARPISALLEGDDYTGAVTAQLVFAFVIVGLAAHALNQMRDLFDFSDLLSLGKNDDRTPDTVPRAVVSSAGARPPVSWRAVVRQPGVPEALFSGLGFGLFFVFIYRAAEDAGHWPLVVARAVSVVMFCFIAFSTRSALLPERGSRRPVVLAGLLDAAAAVFFVMSTRAGLLSVGAVLAALYPVVTVLLARVITKERIRRKQMAGLTLALCAVALLAA